MKKIYFLGAGASYEDGLPITADLMHGVMGELYHPQASESGVVDVRGDYYPITKEFLKKRFGISDIDFNKSNIYFNEKYVFGPKGTKEPRNYCIINVLDLIDSSIRSASGIRFGGMCFDAAELHKVRRGIELALIDTMGIHHRVDVKYSKQFIAKLGKDDTVITTNWDISLDIALDQKSGANYGIDVVIDYGSEAAPTHTGERGMLLKLHGSLNFRNCAKCRKIYVNPKRPIAVLLSSDKYKCCGNAFINNLILPGLSKDYSSAHKKIRDVASEHLANAEEWIFIGYSLPPDDTEIRKMLTDAASNHASRCPPRVTVVDPSITNIIGNYTMALPGISIESKSISFNKYITSMMR